MPVDRRDFIKGVAAGAVGAGLAGMAGRDLFAAEDPKKPKLVKTRKLGRTKIDISVISYGTGALSSDKLKLLEAAVARGVNLIDTGWSYGGGEAERAVGKFLAGRKDREKLYVLTKTSGFESKATAKETYKALKAEVQKDLKERLKTDYIDILMCPHGAHSPESVRDKKLHEALTKLKEDDKLIRWIGASTHTNYAATCEAALQDGFYDVLMPVMNVATQKSDKARPPARDGRRRPPIMKPLDTTKMMKLAKEKNVGVIVMKAANERFLAGNVDELLKDEFKKDSKLTRHQKLYAFALAQGGTCSVTVGISATNHLREAIQLGLSI